MFGSFDPETLERYAQLAAEKAGVDFAEDDTYDFTRCVRSDGSVYGTSGKCRKGTETGDKEEKKKGGSPKKMDDASFKDFMKGVVEKASQVGWEDYNDSPEQAKEDFRNYVKSEKTDKGWKLTYEEDGYKEDIGSLSKGGKWKTAKDNYGYDSRIGDQIQAWMKQSGQA